VSALFEPRGAARVYAGIFALIGLFALALAVVGSAQARSLLPLGFGRLPEDGATVATIALNNARVALVPFGLALLAQQAVGIRRVGDLVVAGLLALNAAQLAAALVGYGVRAVVALVPHTLVELAAYAVAGAVYLRGRQEPLGLGAVVLPALACAALLAIAAVLETYVQLRLAP
jgi:uncharacterized membrane protein SpoIIM required for sporulation